MRARRPNWHHKRPGAPSAQVRAITSAKKVSRVSQTLTSSHALASLSMHKRSGRPLPVSRPIIYPGTLPTPEAAAAAKKVQEWGDLRDKEREKLAAKEAERKEAAKRSAERSRGAGTNSGVVRKPAQSSGPHGAKVGSGGRYMYQDPEGRLWADKGAYDRFQKNSKDPLPESLARKFPGKTATQIHNMRAQSSRMDPGDELELPELSDDEKKWLRNH